MSSSPWGTIDHVTRLERGVSFVSTPSHGGLRVSKGYAERRLSVACLQRAIRLGAYYYWEEDCAYCVAMWELPHLWDRIGRSHPRQDLLLSLSRCNADYLVSISVEPLEPQYSSWKAHKQEDEMRERRDPDLITGAMRLDNSNHTRVWTADGQEHIVRAASYQIRTPNLLSACTLVIEEQPLPPDPVAGTEYLDSYMQT